MDKSGAAGKARESIDKVNGHADTNVRNCSPDADCPEQANAPRIGRNRFGSYALVHLQSIKSTREAFGHEQIDPRRSVSKVTSSVCASDVDGYLPTAHSGGDFKS
jgi:hypothetical protein